MFTQGVTIFIMIMGALISLGVALSVIDFRNTQGKEKKDH